MSTAVYWNGFEVVIFAAGQITVGLNAIGREKLQEWVARWMLDRANEPTVDEYGHPSTMGELGRALRDWEPDRVHWTGLR